MVFGHAYGSFGCVGSVVMWWGKLDVNVAVLEEVFEIAGAFVVHAVVLWFATAIRECLVNACQCLG